MKTVTDALKEAGEVATKTGVAQGVYRAAPGVFFYLPVPWSPNVQYVGTAIPDKGEK